MSGAGVAEAPSVCLPLVCSVARHAASSAAGVIFDAMSRWVLQGAAWLVDQAIQGALRTTAPDLDAGWLRHEEATMVSVALLVVVPLLGAATIGAVLRQDLQRLVRVYAVGVPVAILCGAGALAFSVAAVEVVDELCRLVTPVHPFTPFEHLGTAAALAAAPSFVQVVIGLVIVVGAIALWLELVLRTVVIDVSVFFLPLALAAFVWPATAPVAKRMVEVVTAVIGSKFVIVATLVLGDAALSSRNAGVDTLVTGTGILLLAAFAPFAVLRLVPLLEAGAVGHLEGMSRRPGRAGAAAARTAAFRGPQMASLLLGRGGNDTSPPGASMVGPAGLARRTGDYRLGPPSVGSGGSGGSSSGAGSSGAGSSGGSGSSSGSGSSTGGASGGVPGDSGASRDSGASGGAVLRAAGGSRPASVPGPAAPTPVASCQRLPQPAPAPQGSARHGAAPPSPARPGPAASATDTPPGRAQEPLLPGPLPRLPPPTVGRLGGED